MSPNISPRIQQPRYRSTMEQVGSLDKYEILDCYAPREPSEDRRMLPTQKSPRDYDASDLDGYATLLTQKVPDDDASFLQWASRNTLEQVPSSTQKAPRTDREHDHGNDADEDAALLPQLFQHSTKHGPPSDEHNLPSPSTSTSTSKQDSTPSPHQKKRASTPALHQSRVSKRAAHLRRWPTYRTTRAMMQRMGSRDDQSRNPESQPEPKE